MESLRKAHPVTQKFADLKGHDLPVSGRVLELWSHPSLDGYGPLDSLGVDPSQLVLNDSAPTPDFSEVLKQCGGVVRQDGDNNTKFGIGRLPLGTKDHNGFTVDYYRTDWDTWLSVRKYAEKHDEFRHRHMDTSAEGILLPQSMSLQYIVRFRNGDLLALQRGDRVESQAGRWSFSGEEQLSKDDFGQGPTAAGIRLFRRTFLEEVYGLRPEEIAQADGDWEMDCQPMIKSMRLWSFFLEETVGSIQMFGLFQLKVNPDELKESHKRRTMNGKGARDNEGKLWIVPHTGISELLTRGYTFATRLHRPEGALVDAEGLHDTSRYRLWRLHCALERKLR